MDDNGHRENARHKPPQGQWMMQHQPSMKQIMAIMAERDAAIQEKNLALSEKKTALAERDMAILQRDSAISERNNAIMERDNAIATLQYRENSMNGENIKHMHQPHHYIHHQSHLSEAPQSSRDIHMDDCHDAVPISPEPSKPKRTKRAKERTVASTSKKAPKTSKRVKKEGADSNKAMFDDLNRQLVGSKPDWKDQDLGLNLVVFDETTMPVPVCTCTGVPRPCYKWGNGGWQSSCCTTTMSMHPLPSLPNKRHSRVGGRKMSGGAFNKLLSRLSGEGYDLSVPVDLKEHWAKHGTNRYITIK